MTGAIGFIKGASDDEKLLDGCPTKGVARCFCLSGECSANITQTSAANFIDPVNLMVTQDG